MTVNHLIKITRFHPGQIYYGFIFFRFSSHLCFTFVFNLIWGQVVSKAGTPITMICRVSVRSEQVFQYKHSTSVNITHINIPNLNKCMHQNLIRHAVLIQLIRANAPSVQQSVLVFIPESDGTDTAREIRYKTHRTYLAKSAFFIFPPSMRICWCYFSKCHPCSNKKKKGLLLWPIWASCADLLIPQSMAEDVVHVLVQPLQATIPRPHVRVVGGQETLHCGLQAGQQLPVLLSGRQQGSKKTLNKEGGTEVLVLAMQLINPLII